VTRSISVQKRVNLSRLVPAEISAILNLPMHVVVTRQEAQMRFRTINTLLLSVAFTVCGCFSHDNNLKSTVKRLTVSEQTFLAITNGLSLDVVVDTLGISAFHSFTVAGTNGTHTLISCHTAGDLSVFWLLFRDKRLIKIIVPFTLPGYLEKYPYQGTTATRIKPWAIDDVVIMEWVKEIVDAPALSHEQMKDYLKPYSGVSSHPNIFSILPAFILSGIAEKMAPQIEKDYKINEELATRYNGCLANLGMDTEDVEKLFGKPLRVFTTKNKQTVRIYGYGDNRELQVNPQLAFNGMAVVNDTNGHVMAIYSHEFFNAKWK